MSFIETDRLLLRTWILPGDRAAAEEMFGDILSQKYYLRRATPPERIAPYIASLVAKEERDGFGVWPVVEKERRVVVGACGLSRVPDRENDIEIEWVFRADARGRGYASEAAAAVLQYAFDELVLPRVCALVDPENTPSIAIINRLGMRYDRVVRAYNRDLMRYAKERS